jgi:dihydrofolate reductase
MRDQTGRAERTQGADQMSSVLYMSMSLDGYVAGPNEGPGNGLGDGGPRLHDWAIGDAEASGVNRQVMDEAMSSGAVVAGRQTFELADGWGGDHHDGVPIFIVSRHPPGVDVTEWPLVSYVSDAETAMARAKEAAGERNVLVHGAGTAPLLLDAGVLDEIQIHLIPVLFGAGRGLLDHLGEHVELELIRVLEGRGVTHLRYRVRR